MNGIDLKAIVLATLGVFAIDFLWGAALTAILGGDRFHAGMSDEQVRQAFIELIQNTAYLQAALVLGTASTVVGGYLTARLARALPYFNALGFGLLGVVLGAFTSGELPTWFRVIGLTLSIPAALWGASLFKKQLAKRPERKSTR